MLRRLPFAIAILCIFYLSETTAQNATISVPLNQTISLVNKELFGHFVYLNRSSTLEVILLPARKSISFIIFQVHSHLHNVILYNNTLSKNNYANGTNVGLYGLAKPKFDTYYIWNPNVIDLKVYVSIHGYTLLDPIPGGCNMEFPVPVTPFLHTTYTKDYVFVDAGAAKGPNDKLCTSITDPIVQFYRFFLPEESFDADTYFKGLRNMLTLDVIEENGDLIPADAVWKMRRMLSAYPGTGSIFVAVAYSTTTKAYSVYVPTYSYACSPLKDDCDLIDEVLPKFVCASMIFMGIFICYFGHKFFKTEMFLTGVGTGFIVTYILISLIAEFSLTALTSVSLLCGLFFGAIWLLVWWFFGIPLLSVILPTLNLGFLFAAIMYYRMPGGQFVMQNDFNFWTMFLFVMIVTSVFLVSMTFLSNILCCAILGAYAIVYPIDYYLGSNTKYIMINVVRRAIVPNFNRAVLEPPFQWRDLLVTLLWAMLAITGFLYQHYQNRSRPPFPPPPRSISPRSPGDVLNGRRIQRYGAIGSTSIESGYSANPSVLRGDRTTLLA